MDELNGTEKRPRSRRSVRQDILGAAMELFAKEGSRGTSLATIAERIGVTAPAITHHFGSRRALLMEVVDQTDRLTQRRLQPPTDAPGLDQFIANRQWAQVLIDDQELANLVRLATVMTAEALDPDFPAHHHFLTRHRQFRRMLAEMVQAGQQDGSIRAEVDPKVVATQVLAFLQGTQLHWFLDPDDVPLREVFDDYFDRLRRDLASPRTINKSAPLAKKTGRQTRRPA